MAPPSLSSHTRRTLGILFGPGHVRDQLQLSGVVSFMSGSLTISCGPPASFSLSY